MNAIRNEMNEDIVVEKIRNCMRIYKKLVNVVQDDMVIMKPLMTQSALLEGVIEFIVTTTPALFGELINIRVTEMRLIVEKQLLFCEGKITRDAIEDAMLFFRYQPFKYTVWRLFTVDGTLIISIVGLLATFFYNKQFETTIHKIRNINADMKLDDRVTLSAILFYGGAFLRTSAHAIFVTVSTMIPKLLEATYSSFIHGGIRRYKVIIFENILDFIVSLSPAFLAEMVNKEVDKMKLIVVKLLLVCKDATSRDAVTDAMTIFKQYPFKYSVGRMFTLNMSLVLTIVYLLTTYIIALVQFSHFYG
ncbi:hypothetical protein HW555_008297 [Spodoptera exigua]|uniref:Gustatory receptor n=1 Tax=Spodoptera exigua TaxID=7107 RepID=A0A835GFC3_SPOEX|nr:hypothetical protein HW555_008297 [Spodoptera exigua]